MKYGTLTKVTAHCQRQLLFSSVQFSFTYIDSHTSHLIHQYWRENLRRSPVRSTFLFQLVESGDREEVQREIKNNKWLRFQE